MYEDEAQESDDDFIDDSDVDESDSDAVVLAKQEFNSGLRNRKSWIDSSTTCPTCRSDEITRETWLLYRIELQTRGAAHVHITFQ
jgi:hypothetical protein